MATYVQDVIDAAHDPEVAVLVFTGAVTGEIDAGNLAPVLTYVAVGVTIDGAEHARPRTADNEESAVPVRNRLTVHGDNFRDHTREWASRRSGFGCNRTRDGRDHDVSSFGLPPGINDRTTIV